MEKERGNNFIKKVRKEKPPLPRSKEFHFLYSTCLTNNNTDINEIFVKSHPGVSRLYNQKLVVTSFVCNLLVLGDETSDVNRKCRDFTLREMEVFPSIIAVFQELKKTSITKSSKDHHKIGSVLKERRL